MVRPIPRGFTLIELLVVITIIAILASLIIMGWPAMKSATQRTASLNNLRAIGVAARLYATDNDGKLPGRVQSTDKWPKLFAAYLDDTKVYAAVGDTNNYIYTGKNPLDNEGNYTSYILNGFNDIGTYNDETVEVRILQIERQSEVILFGTPKSGSRHFYMDMEGSGGGDHNTILDLELYDKGSNYLFVDGSARYIKKVDYDARMWLVNKDYPVPPAP